MKPRRLAVLVLLLAVAAIVWKSTRPDPRPAAVAGEGGAPRRDAPRADSHASPPHSTTPGTPGKAAANPAKQAPSVTKAKRRDAITSPDGTRRTIIDPMASWRETPPWPEGQRLYAEVDTASRRYVNLRPNGMGIMPMLTVNPREALSLRLSLPENQPGDTIHLELPNGGNFPGEELRGKTMAVSEARTLEFRMSAADARGHCTIHIRQAGHTRTLPLWIGEPGDTPAEDTADPNRPAS
jgi:hypothetical protein